MTDYVYESKPTVIDQPKSMLLRVGLLGAFLGLVTWALTYVLERFVLTALLCDGDQVCTQSTVFAGNIAAIILALAGVAILVRMSVYRPLLIVLGVVVSLWGLSVWLRGVGVLEGAAWTVVLYTLAYGAYAWIARIRNVPVLLIVVALLAVATRIVPHLF